MPPIKLSWKLPENPSAYVKQTLATEADDIPLSLIDNAEWIIQTVKLSDIEVNSEMIAMHDKDPIHLERRDNFVKMIKENQPILPVIVLGNNFKLVDGYARYRALKQLGVDEIIILIQKVW